MSTQHKNITEADLHECKGASTSAVDTVNVSTGLGTAQWIKISPKSLYAVSTNGIAGQQVIVDGAGGFIVESPPCGEITFVNTAAPYVFAATTIFQKIATTTTASGLGVLFTEGTNARLTYTGTQTRVFKTKFVCSLNHAAGANRDISISIAKNGSAIASTEVIGGVVTATNANMSTETLVSLATNDYVEAFVKISVNGNINFLTFNLLANQV